MAELPEDEVEAVAQAAAGAARAGGGVVQMRDALLPELHLLAARVRAEAVAAERQRWERLVRAHLSPEGVGGPDQAARNSVLQRVLAAGSVPVATSEPDSVAELARRCAECTEDGLGNCQHGCRNRTGPVATPVRPRRYDQCDGTCTVDCGHCKGQGRPVVTPTEPTADLLHDVDRLRWMWAESPDTRAYVEDRYPGLGHAIERAVMHTASPVPAEQPEGR